jgi:hypothetical protein
MPDGHARSDGGAVGNGRPFNRAERRAAIEAALRSRPGESNRAIAADLGVHHTTVATIREQLVTTGEISQFEKTIGADGKARRRPPPRAKTTPAAAAADLAALAAAVKLDRELTNARLAALEHSDEENRKMLGREPPAPTPGSAWGVVKEAARQTGFSTSAIWNFINRKQAEWMTTPTGRVIVRIASVPPRRSRASKCV